MIERGTGLAMPAAPQAEQVGLNAKLSLFHRFHMEFGCFGIIISV
jgi:hypothetical protein